MIDELDSEVRALGPISWELGPGMQNNWRLTLTPDGDRALLPLTAAIVARAPEIVGWEVASSRQPREWDLTFSMSLSSGDTVEIDARSWNYVLWRFSDGSLDIKIGLDGVTSLSDEDRYRAAVIVLDGLLGEERRLEKLETIEVVTRLESDELSRATPIALLPQHLSS